MIHEWKKLKEEIYPLEYRVVAKRKYELPNGKTENYDILLYHPVSIIVALTKDNMVVMTKQFRPGPEEILLEIPGGIIDEGETPVIAAKRELLEETGYLGEFTYVGPMYRDAYSTIVLHTLVARSCHKVQEPETEANEFIEPIEISLGEFRTHLKTGQLTDVGPGYLALDYLGLL